MIEQTLATAYYQKKEKALTQRKEIDYVMRKHLSDLKKDKSAQGKSAINAYEAEIELAEQAFQETILEIQNIYTELFPLLERENSTKAAPLIVDSEECQFTIYIDDNKNIHYQTR